MTKLFLSHASEDKTDFARPLYEALKVKYEVWYDEYSLTIGDSLLQKIDKGLAACNYGVVVLSKAFFQKDWPRAELDGLFALEKKRGKLILPIWKDITYDEIVELSPILASRLGAKTNAGIKNVVDEIQRAIEAAERATEVSFRESLLEKFKSIDSEAQNDRAAQLKMYSSEAIGEINEAGTTVLKTFWDGINLINSQSKEFSYGIKQETIAGRRHSILVTGPYDLHLKVEFDPNFRADAAEVSVFIWRIVRGNTFEPPVGFKSARHDTIQEEVFSVGFDSDLSVCWKSKTISMSSEEICDYALERFLIQIEKARKGRT